MAESGPIAGVGVDLLEIARLEAALERRPRLRERVFHPGELELADRHRRPARQLATRFCAKEAALKALGVGGLRLHEVEVLGGGDSPPRIRLHGGVAEAARAAGIRLSVSLSHEREVAVAVVLASRL
jgi:holo-[acyl-carrier protein] synthase